MVEKTELEMLEGLENHEYLEACKRLLEVKNGEVVNNSLTLDSKNVLSKEMSDHFSNLGYIQRGMDRGRNERWQVTEFGKSQLKSCIRLADQEELADIAFSC